MMGRPVVISLTYEFTQINRICSIERNISHNLFDVQAYKILFLLPNIHFWIAGLRITYFNRIDANIYMPSMTFHIPIGVQTMNNRMNLYKIIFEMLFCVT